MTALTEYLLKVIICSGVLSAYYWLALRNKIFHHWNRFYLLSAVVLSLTLPLMKVQLWYHPTEQSAASYKVLQTITTNESWFEDEAQPIAEVSTYFTAERISAYLYLFVSLLILIGFLKALVAIFRLYRKYQHWKTEHLVFVDTDAKGTPFSFFNYIFWNRNIAFESTQGQQIFAHELVHVKEKHSWDKLLLNLLLIAFWINPFFWLIRKELSMIHEFIADKKAVQDQDSSVLAAMILATAFPGHTLPFTNPFFYSPIKRRLLMLSKLKNPKASYIGRLLLLPLLTFLVTAFAVKINHAEKNSSAVSSLEQPLTVVIDAGHGYVNGKPDGAKGLNNLHEDEIALAICNKIKALNKDANLKLVFTRPTEAYVDLNERLRISTEQNADLFISIHAAYAPPINEQGKRTDNPANGAEIYVSKDGTPNLAKSKELGLTILSEMKTVMAIHEPGLKQRQKGIYVIQSNPAPSVLIECGFLSNKKDAEFISNEKSQEQIAASILKGIVNYAKSNNQSSQGKNVKKANYKDTIPDKKPEERIKIPEGTPIFTKAEIMPQFPGGTDAWNRYMEKVIKENMNILIADGNEGQCEVEFIVTPEGLVSNVRAKTMQNSKLANVLIEAIKKGPKWNPANQNNRKVYCWTTEKLMFRLPPSPTTQPISIANAYMQNLFIGIDNPLVITMENTPGSQLQVTSNNGTITKVKGTWVARPAFEGKAVIMVTDPKTNQEIKFLFTVKQLAVPAITLGDSKAGRIAVHKITDVKQLVIDEDWQIKNYTMYFTGRGFPEPFFVAANTSAEFNQPVLEALAKCLPGTTIVIDEIIVQKGSIKTPAPPLAFNIY